MRSLNILTNLKHAVRHLVPKRRTVKAPAPDYAQHFIGSWSFLDTKTHHNHLLQIAPDLTIQIDGQEIPGHITGLDANALTFLDHFGYQLVVHTNGHGPVSIYDESSNLDYPITAAAAHSNQQA
ncbi:DUF4828 domain-containing protein [Schleiferilactobacillus perolens]|jgi:hypothetical protein|uniref:DUF4828 domain-containing protein n=1 Tax=Schleiferilactobacillus perolens DSM 12744 TaxID=1423792 RepID=A0A0R1N5N8_9LACO|nr:DUF4828 domain-containing protein [Schleiferilactobacillus perolens]KRL12243.1 hypothetical protein FD09_GL003113 [Schleiferilactobacillus perolens DSM 12744]MCI1891192.1 DUF4828 domain-containing protein [Schleiferilactobacillus harbinensis]MCI1911870.1 DUF4828 domain-containing protein [Schleiferilactobacillus harbinensis]MCI2171641.1 DUF4828 domain-containing protein [Schleiferilactobacillus perolens]